MDPCCPNPVVLQPLSTDHLRTYIDAVGQQWSQQGYTSSTATYTMRLLADLSSGLQRHALTAADCNEQLASDFLPDRYRHRRPHRKAISCKDFTSLGCGSRLDQNVVLG